MRMLLWNLCSMPDLDLCPAMLPLQILQALASGMQPM